MNHTNGMETLERRVLRLERENRTLKRAGLLALGAVGAVLLMGQAGKQEVAAAIKTRRLEVVNEAGETRALLFTAKTGTTGLSLYDEDGRARVSISASSLLGGNVSLQDKTEKGRAILSAKSDAATLGLFDESGQVRVTLHANKSWPALVLSDEAGKPRAQLIAAKGDPFLALEDAEGYSATLGTTDLVDPKSGATTKRSAASLVMLDKAKSVVWQAPQ